MSELPDLGVQTMADVRLELEMGMKIGISPQFQNHNKHRDRAGGRTIGHSPIRVVLLLK